MSISLRLDAPAVRSLIGNDDEFTLDLSRAVIAEIVNKLPKQLQSHIDKAIHSEITEQIRAASSNGVSSAVGYNERTSLSQDLQKKIKEAADRYVSQKILEGTQAAEAAADARIEKWQSQIDAVVRQRIDRAMNDEINKKVAARLSEVLAAVSKSSLESVA